MIILVILEFLFVKYIFTHLFSSSTDFEYQKELDDIEDL